MWSRVWTLLFSGAVYYFPLIKSERINLYYVLLQPKISKINVWLLDCDFMPAVLSRLIDDVKWRFDSYNSVKVRINYTCSHTYLK